MAMATSPMAPTTNGRKPCFFNSRKLVRRPTPAKVNRNAQRERFARQPSWSLLNAPQVGQQRNQQRKPSTNFGGTSCHRNAALPFTTCAWPLLDQ